MPERYLMTRPVFKESNPPPLCLRMHVQHKISREKTLSGSTQIGTPWFQQRDARFSPVIASAST